MKRTQFYSFLFVLSLVFSVSAQKAQTASTAGSNLRKAVEYLASDKLEGRRTGERGAVLAAGYISDLFASYRLKPGVRRPNGKGSFLQAFPYVTGVELAPAGNAFQLEFPDGVRAAQAQSAIPVGFSPNGRVDKARIILAGYGIVSKDPAVNDYGDQDANGKVVMVFDGTPDSDNPHNPLDRFDVRTKALVAKDKGAVGLLVISDQDVLANDKLAQMKYDQTLGEAAVPTMVISRETAAGILAVKPEELELIEGVAGLKDQTPAHAAVRFHKTIPTVSFKVDLVKKHADAYNVVGILPGTDAVLKNEAIIIGGHYDHLGHGGQGSLDVNSTEIHHGADDNASGTAAVIELAREFAKNKKNKRTLIFIAFAGEEEGLIGSKFYVNNPVFPLDKTVAMINMDMVGRLKDQKLTIGGIGTASEWKGLVEKNNSSSQITAVALKPGAGTGAFTLQLNEDGFGPSDHSSFYGKKIPVLFLFTGTHEDYHKPSDTADKINYGGLEHVVSYVAGIVKAIDQAPQRPNYTVAKSSGVSGGKAGFNVSLGTVPSYADSTDGLVLDGVRDNSPAAKAGLKAGDKVVKLAGKDVRNVMDYTYILGEMRAGEEYEVVVLRGTERMTFKIVPVRR